MRVSPTASLPRPLTHPAPVAGSFPETRNRFRTTERAEKFVLNKKNLLNMQKYSSVVTSAPSNFPTRTARNGFSLFFLPVTRLGFSGLSSPRARHRGFHSFYTVRSRPKHLPHYPQRPLHARRFSTSPNYLNPLWISIFFSSNAPARRPTPSSTERSRHGSPRSRRYLVVCAHTLDGDAAETIDKNRSLNETNVRTPINNGTL